jgi:predicted glycosyltransferase
VRVLCYAQHLSGVGHFVRTHALACGLAEAHDVRLVDGGRPVPRLPGPPTMRLLPLPRVHRQQGALAPLAGDRPLAEVMAERARRLAAAIAAAPPDVMTIEHYPWSKWDMEREILAAIRTARRSHPAVRVVCSLRDIAPRTRFEAVPEREYERRVLDRLAAHFDAVLVHSDPRFTRLEEHFRRAPELPVPWAYTGFVCAADAGREHGLGVWPGLAHAHPDGGGAFLPPSYAVLSAGSGAHELPFLRAASEAFGRLAASGELGAMRLVIFAGLSGEGADLDARGEGSTVVLPFSPEFPSRLRRSALSISRAGYNTCADLLAARVVPAVLVPHPRMSDQGVRAERMRAHGLATLAPGDPPAPDALMEAIRQALAAGPAAHRFALGGVQATRVLLERLHRDGTLSGIGAPEATAPEDLTIPPGLDEAGPPS